MPVQPSPYPSSSSARPLAQLVIHHVKPPPSAQIEPSIHACRAFASELRVDENRGVARYDRGQAMLFGPHTNCQ